MERPESPDTRPDHKPRYMPPTSMTGREFLAILEEAGAIGMWADRDDIGDSVEYARKLRDEAQTRMRD